MKFIGSEKIYIRIGGRLATVLMLTALFLLIMKSLAGTAGILLAGVIYFVFILFRKGCIIGKIVIYILLSGVFLLIILL